MSRIIVFLLFSLSLNAHGIEIGDVSIPDNAQVAGKPLVLNGAGYRKKFFVKVYVGALYLPSATRSAQDAIGQPGPKRVLMHFLHSEVDARKLVKGWNDGFEANLSADELAALRPRIDRFNGLFETVRRGDRILIDFLPGTGTRVTLRGAEKGVVPGDDFFAALLRIWLGEHPASDGLKKAMLGG